MRSFLALLALMAALAPLALAQDDDVAALETTLKATRLRYQKNEEGDYRFSLSWSNEKRAQAVVVRRRSTSLQDGVTVRELRSVSWRGKECPSAGVLEALLRDHPDLGAWRLEQEAEGWAVYLHTDLPDELKPSTLKRWIVIVAEEADQMEKKLNGGKADAF